MNSSGHSSSCTAPVEGWVLDGAMGRESSHGRKELFNLPPLVLKARAPNDGSAFCIGF